MGANVPVIPTIIWEANDSGQRELKEIYVVATFQFLTIWRAITFTKGEDAAKAEETLRSIMKKC